MTIKVTPIPRVVKQAISAKLQNEADRDALLCRAWDWVRDQLPKRLARYRKYYQNLLVTTNQLSANEHYVGFVEKLLAEKYALRFRDRGSARMDQYGFGLQVADRRHEKAQAKIRKKYSWVDELSTPEYIKEGKAERQAELEVMKDLYPPRKVIAGSIRHKLETQIKPVFDETDFRLIYLGHLWDKVYAYQYERQNVDAKPRLWNRIAKAWERQENLREWYNRIMISAGGDTLPDKGSFWARAKALPE